MKIKDCLCLPCWALARTGVMCAHLCPVLLAFFQSFSSGRLHMGLCSQYGSKKAELVPGAQPVCGGVGSSPPPFFLFKCGQGRVEPCPPTQGGRAGFIPHPNIVLPQALSNTSLSWDKICDSSRSGVRVGSGNEGQEGGSECSAASGSGLRTGGLGAGVLLSASKSVMNNSHLPVGFMHVM